MCGTQSEEFLLVNGSGSGVECQQHVLTIMVLNGKTYVFDPQVEDAIAGRTSSKEIQYVRFGLAEPNGKYKYNGRSRARQMEKFDRFLAENGYFAY